LSGTNLISQIAQSDGSLLNVTYDQTTSPDASKVKTLSDGLGRTTTFDYTVAGQTTVTDALGNATIYQYDSTANYGRLKNIVLPRPPGSHGTTGHIVYQYASNGNVQKLTGPAGRTTWYNYDSHHNCVEVQTVNPDGSANTVQRTYDSGDHLLTETHFNGTVAGP